MYYTSQAQGPRTFLGVTFNPGTDQITEDEARRALQSPSFRAAQEAGRITLSVTPVPAAPTAAPLGSDLLPKIDINTAKPAELIKLFMGESEDIELLSVATEMAKAIANNRPYEKASQVYRQSGIVDVDAEAVDDLWHNAAGRFDVFNQALSAPEPEPPEAPAPREPEDDRPNLVFPTDALDRLKAINGIGPKTAGTLLEGFTQGFKDVDQVREAAVGINDTALDDLEELVKSWQPDYVPPDAGEGDGKDESDNPPEV